VSTLYNKKKLDKQKYSQGLYLQKGQVNYLHKLKLVKTRLIVSLAIAPLTALKHTKPYTASNSIGVAFPQDEYHGFVNPWKQLIENELTQA